MVTMMVDLNSFQVHEYCSYKHVLVLQYLYKTKLYNLKTKSIDMHEHILHKSLTM